MASAGLKLAVPAEDDLDRWVKFCNSTEAWDKALKALGSGIRMFQDIVPSEETSKTIDFVWRYILDARKTSWMFKSVKEIQGIRAALRASGDRQLAQMRAMVRMFFAGRWLFENLHILTKVLPNGKGNIFKVQDPMRLNRLAKLCWQLALLTNLSVDMRALSLSEGKESEKDRKMRRLRLVNIICDSVLCCNILQVPQKISKTFLGKEKAFYNSFVGLNGLIAGLIQCYTVYPAKPQPALTNSAS